MMDELSTAGLTESSTHFAFQSSGRSPGPRPLVSCSSARPMDEVLPEDNVNGGTEIRVRFTWRKVPEAWAKDARLAAARAAAPRSTARECGAAVGRREGHPRGVTVGVAQRNVPSKSKHIFRYRRVTAGFFYLLQLLRRLFVLDVDRRDVTDMNSGKVEGLENGST